MTVQGMQQHEQSSVLRQEHFPPWGLTMDPAVEEMEEVVDAGIFVVAVARSAVVGRGAGVGWGL